MDSELKTLDFSGYAMAYHELGNGSPLVLIHGSLGDYRSWSLQMEHLGKYYRTIAVSLRHCHPDSWDGGGRSFSLVQHYTDLAEFLSGLDAGPVNLVGHSRGGNVALLLAAKFPLLVERLILADPAPLQSMLPKTAEVLSALECRNRTVQKALELIEEGDIDGGLESFTDAVSRLGQWQNLPEAAKQSRRDNAWSLKSLVSDAQEPFTCKDAQTIQVPTLLLSGENSPAIYGLMHTALTACLPRHQMITLPSASHGMQRDNPQAFNKAVLEFLGKI